MQQPVTFTIERIINAPVPKVWKAITDKNEMKQWYFDLAAFRPEVGFAFHFYGGDEKKQYLHLCKITEVVPGKKIAYTWQYENDPAMTVVSFELFEEGNATRVKLTHTGLGQFATDDPNFKVSSFEAGWTQIIGTNLKNHLER